MGIGIGSKATRCPEDVLQAIIPFKQIKSWIGDRASDIDLPLWGGSGGGEGDLQGLPFTASIE
jgi:hypothetical protein